MKQEKDTGRDQRVVLNLSLEQAKALKGFLYLDGVARGNDFDCYEIALKLYERLEKTINKHENSRTIPVEEWPGRKELSCRDNFATQQEALELPEDVMEAITQATQDAINEQEPCLRCVLDGEKVDCKGIVIKKVK
jgi:hypothetical protein